MSAYTDQRATERFAELLDDLRVDHNLDVQDGSEAGFLVPRGETLVVRNYETDEEFLITVRKVKR